MSDAAVSRPPATDDRATLLAWLKAHDGDHEKRFWDGEDVRVLVAERAALIDALLVQLWQQAWLGANACLVAVGGYGRGVLHPHSDIDLLILTKRDPRPADRDAISAFLTVLWDLKLEIGHSVRTVSQCIDAARADLTIMTTMMEARPLDGKTRLYEKLATRIAGRRLWPSENFFRAKVEEQANRYKRFGDSAYNLEPNLKEGPGGLRDIQLISWIAAREFGDDAEQCLVSEQHAEAEEIEALEEEQAALWRMRYGLHLLAGRREDRILFEHQRELAKRFGFEDGHVENLGVEQMMQGYFRSVRHIDRITERLMQAMEERLYAGRQREVEEIDEWFKIVNGNLAARDDDLFDKRPALLMEMFVRLAERPDIRGVRAETIRRIRRAVGYIDDDFRADPDVRAAFMAVLRSGADVPGLLTRMHRYDILDRYLPIFGAITGRMQYDLFHVYTVDEHTLTVLRRMHAFLVAPDRKKYPMTHELMYRLHKPELLYLAGIFHDIAKGRGGDHSELGADDAQAFCEAHGLSPADTRLVVWLVRLHLIMSVTAQKKDISDPEVVNEFARQVGNVRYLKFLYLLTVADISGTSPKLWNGWKGKLLQDLYRLTREALDRGLENPARREEWISDTRAGARSKLDAEGVSAERIGAAWASLPPGYFLRHSANQVCWHTQLMLEHEALPIIGVRKEANEECTELFVCAEDRDGTFATIVGCIGEVQLNIIDARLFNLGDGRIIDTFQVLDNEQQPVDELRRATRLAEHLEAALSQRPLRPAPAQASLPRKLQHFVRKPKIRFSEVRGQTCLDIYASDRPGLLARLSQALLANRIRVHSARIATFGERVEDHFVLTDEHGQPLGDDALGPLRQDLRAALGGDMPAQITPLGTWATGEVETQ
ncbi:MAG: [protein-PII] uridylyltransferase [Pseudomonadota bacterium]